MAQLIKLIMNRNQKQDLYDRLIRELPGIERKGRTIPYNSVKGHMFTLVTKEGDIGIRLPREEREKFLDKFKTGPIVSYGTLMKEYVKVPEQMLFDLDSLKKYVEISHAYASSLKPKK